MGRMPAILLRLRSALFLSALSLLLVTTLHSQTWREVQSPHFRVVTEGSEKEGRAVALEFEQMRHVFEARFKKATLETGSPLLIMAVREKGLRELGPGFYEERDRVAGEFFKGWERQFALVRLDAFGDENQSVIFHEYTHSILHANLHWLPVWLDEGLAEFYAYTRFQSDKVYVGAPTIHYEHLISDAHIPIADLMVVKDSLFGKDSRRSELFYADSWAAVHYMIYGPGMEGGAKLDRFMLALDSGTPQPAAFQQVFGDTKPFDKGLSNYLNKLSMTASVMPPGGVPDATYFTARVLTPAEADYELGAFETGAHDRTSATMHLEKAVALNPELAGPHEELAYLAWAQGQDDKAREQWQTAVKLDPTRYRSTFALLMSDKPLRQQSDEQLAATLAALEKINVIAPKFAPALVEQSLIKWRQGHLNDAYKLARSAEKLEPWRAGYRLLAGNILLRGNQPAVAAGYARMVADRWPGSDHDEAVDLWNQLPAANRDATGAPMTLLLPQNATQVRGTIVSTACDKGHLNVSALCRSSPTPR